MCLFKYHAMEVRGDIAPRSIHPDTNGAYQFQGIKFRSSFMSVGLYADTCRHLSQYTYIACSFQFECCAVRLDLCVRGKKLYVVRFGVYIVVFRCRFSHPRPLSIANGGTAFLSNVGTTQTSAQSSTSQNA
jgi:hypothetical protein